MKKIIVFFSLSLALFASCESKEDIPLFPTVKNEYDASKPHSLTSIAPLYGGINTPFIVTGNFGDVALIVWLAMEYCSSMNKQNR